MIGALSARVTPLHALPAGRKLVALCLFCTALGAAPWPWAGWLGLALLLALAGRIGAWFLRLLLADLRSIAVIAALIVAWHGATGRMGEGAALAGTLLACIAAASLLNRTTAPSDILATLEDLFEALRIGRRLRQRLALAITLTLRFVPALQDRARVLSEAHRARSPRRIGWRLVVPLALGALDEADRAAEALRARSYLD